MLALGGKIFAKAGSPAEAREILVMLRGRTHELVSAVALARGGTVHWQASAMAEMAMRDFSDEFIGSYLERIGDRALQCVGCYEIEGLGVQLFDDIDGDYFTILGIPLLPLLARLRAGRNDRGMKRACVIGWPIAHSRSPLIHGSWLRQYGIDGAYSKEPVKPEDLAELFEFTSDARLRRLQRHGAA